MLPPISCPGPNLDILVEGSLDDRTSDERCSWLSGCLEWNNRTVARGAFPSRPFRNLEQPLPPFSLVSFWFFLLHLFLSLQLYLVLYLYNIIYPRPYERFSVIVGSRKPRAPSNHCDLNSNLLTAPVHFKLAN